LVVVSNWFTICVTIGPRMMAAPEADGT